jgi:glycosyltransferase involved in cell wall biosynthesis
MPAGISRAERKLGLHSATLVYSVDNLRYPADHVMRQPGEGVLLGEWHRFGWLRRALCDFDIIHFNFGSTLFPSWRGPTPGLWHYYARLTEMKDLPLLKAAGKGIVVTYQGDDARQGDYCRQHFSISIAHVVGQDYYHPLVDRHKRRIIARMGRYADRIFAVNPDLLRVLPPKAEFLPYGTVDLSEWTPKPRRDPNKPPVVIHAPTHRTAKGTSYIVAAVEQLRREGLPFEFTLVENMSHDQARQVYETADLLVDQLFAGWYGGIAVELMALGVPVICYIREEDLNFIPAEMAAELPILRATSETIYDVLKACLTRRRQELAAVGQRSRRYVERWHDPMGVAARLKSVYEDIVKL